MAATKEIMDKLDETDIELFNFQQHLERYLGCFTVHFLKNQNLEKDQNRTDV